MSYRRDLKRVHRARQLAKRQQRRLTNLEQIGLTAVTLHAHAQKLTIAIDCPTGAPFTDALRESLYERRHALQAEARQLLQAWKADKKLSKLQRKSSKGSTR